MGQRRNRQREAFHKEQARSAEQGQPEEEQEVAEERLRSGKILRRIATGEDILTNGCNMDEAWTKFATGHWQKEMPQREGEYPTATRDGLKASFETVVRLKTGEFKSVMELIHGDNWRGWWWSETLPKLPSPPEW